MSITHLIKFLKYMENPLFKKGWGMYESGEYSLYQFAKFCDRHSFLIF